MPLTKRQSEILSYLQGHIQDQGYAPSFEEIAEQFGFQSLATVHEHLTNLERKGYIRRSYNESRSIEVLPPRGTSAAHRDSAARQGRGGNADRVADAPGEHRGARCRCCPAAVPTTPSGSRAPP